MSQMQMFYTQLVHAPEVDDPGLVSLAQLTKVGPDQVQVLKTALSWTHWLETTE